MARHEAVVATRIPKDVERKLRALAHDDDRSLSQYLRRQLVAMTSGPAARTESEAQPVAERGEGR